MTQPQAQHSFMQPTPRKLQSTIFNRYSEPWVQQTLGYNKPLDVTILRDGHHPDEFKCNRVLYNEFRIRRTMYQGSKGFVVSRSESTHKLWHCQQMDKIFVNPTAQSVPQCVQDVPVRRYRCVTLPETGSYSGSHVVYCPYRIRQAALFIPFDPVQALSFTRHCHARR